MLIKASQRGNGRELALHLLNVQDNEHIEVHAIRGFAADTIIDAFQEAEIISHGTQCQQYLFSISLSPPKDARVPVETFENAIERIADKFGLQQQPHVIVFHEKNARRHCHVVFSRIDAEHMKAINLPFYKNKLMELSKEIYLENDWELPQGFLDRTKRNPLNFTLQEWQQAQRLGHDPKLMKALLKQCWASAHDRQAFERKLDQHGFCLAKGDRRGFVAVDWQGKPFSLSKFCGVKSKDLKEKLGDPQTLPSVEQAQQQFDQVLITRMDTLRKQIIDQHTPQIDILKMQRKQMKEHHHHARVQLKQRQEQRYAQESQIRQNRFSKGLRGLWHRITGAHKRTRELNEIEHFRAMQRDQSERDQMIISQLDERQNLQSTLEAAQQAQQQAVMDLRQTVFSKLPEQKINTVRPVLERESEQNLSRDTGLSL